MKKFNLIYVLLLVMNLTFSQSKSFIDNPYIETQGVSDTLVSPDRIYLNIILDEKDSKGKISVEELENKMNEKLISIEINTNENLVLNDLSSNFKNYFIRKQDIQKVKAYTLMVNTAELAGKVIMAMEEINISNVFLLKTEYSKSHQLLLLLKSKAVMNAKINAEAMVEPLNQKISKAILISDINYINMLTGKTNGIVLRGNRSLTNELPYNPLNIEFEKIKFEAKVNVTFSLE